MLNNIEAERARAALTKAAVAKKLGITSKTYLHYIREERAIPTDTLLKMAELFGCSVGYLLGVDAGSGN